MNKKQLVTTIIVGIVCFVLGYWLKTLNSNHQEVVSSHKDQTSADTSSNSANRTKQSFDHSDEEIDYSKLLKGKYTLRGADWAGFEFMKRNTATWTNELFPNDPDTLRINWINNSTFVATFVSGTIDECPPNVWIKQVVSLDGKKLQLQEINTSWVDAKEEVLTFVKE
ncbi:MAG: hypothetical protein RI922_490 [Bacteroidota bacterium]|jgi:hypothetical protein